MNCFEQGGAERVVSTLANRLVADGYEVIAATEWQGEVEFALDPRVKRVHVGLQPEDEGKGRLSKIRLRFAYLHRLIQKEKPDVVISFLRRPNYRALISTIGTGVPNIPAVRQDPRSCYNTWVDKILIPILYRRAAGCVFQTRQQMEYFPSSLQKRSKVILNPVNDKYLKVETPAQREKVVVSSGRLVGFKNQPMLLRAFLRVHEKHPDYELKLYGTDSEDGTLQKLQAIIKEHHAEGFIHLMGGSDSLDLELPSAALYAFSSDYEGMPNALLEALVMGLPAVATDCPCGGPAAVIENGVNGILVPVGDEEALADGMNRLIEDPAYAQQLGAEARKLRERLSTDAIVKLWTDYITCVINQ